VIGVDTNVIVRLLFDRKASKLPEFQLLS